MAAPVLAAVCAAAVLSGCATGQIQDVPPALGGLPANLPARPAEAPAFPPVHDMPPERAKALLDAEQQKKLQADLIASRDRLGKAGAQSAAKAAAGSAGQTPPPQKDAKKRSRKPGAAQTSGTAGN